MLFLPFKILLNPLMLPATLFATGFIIFKLNTPVCQAIPDDANIFVLTGDPRRIPFAVKKLDGYPKRKLYIIGAGTTALDAKYQTQTEIESSSLNTFENSVAIRKIANRKLLSNMVVITTADHITRAVFLIKKQLPYVKINACPAPLSKMPATKRLERWLNEYIKFLGTIVGINRKGN